MVRKLETTPENGYDKGEGRGQADGNDGDGDSLWERTHETKTGNNIGDTDDFNGI